MKRIIIYSLLLIAHTVYAQQSPRLHPLEKAYKEQSSAALTLLFTEWSNNIQPASQQEIQELNPLQRETYQVFSVFYKPHRLDSLGGSEFGNDIYSKASFLLVQNFIKIRTTDKIYYSDRYIDSVITRVINNSKDADSTKQRLLRKTNGKLSARIREEFGFEDAYSYHNPRDIEAATDSIVNFRPIIKVPGKKCIYLTDRYANTLKSFLGDKHIPFAAGNIMNPARSAGESAKRKKFLENCIKIWYGHWGGYWQLNSYPVASSITFDRSMLYARVSFRMIYEGGEAILKKENGNWVLLSSKLTWIE